jgi:hypothetical protein
MSKKLIVISFVLSLLVTTLALVPVVKADLATDAQGGPYLGIEYGQYTGLGSYDVRYTVARIISQALGILGILSLVIVIYSGFEWMTSGGNEEKAGGARKRLTAAVIGLVIIFSAFAISRFVLTQLFQATTNRSYNTVTDYQGPIN